MLNLIRIFKRFRQETASLAGLEFALVLPLMIILLGGVYDLSEAAIVRAEIYNAADVMAASASNLAVQSDGSTALTLDQVQQVESTIWALVPTMRSGQKSAAPKSITITSVLFFPLPTVPCVWGQTTACSYLADVAWSEGYQASNADGSFTINLPTAICTQAMNSPGQDQVGPNAVLTGTNNLNFFRTLNLSTESQQFGDNTQLNEAGVAPILAVTIEYTYTPLFNFFVIPPYTFWVDAYWPVRSVKKVSALNLNATLTEEPLAQQFTTLVGNATTNVPTGTDVAGTSYCINPAVSNPGPVSNAVLPSS